MKNLLCTIALLLFVGNAWASEGGVLGGNTKQDSAAPSKKEIVKTGYNFGPLPAVAFDADKGFQLGALLNIFDFGDGSTYPNPRQQCQFS